MSSRNGAGQGAEYWLDWFVAGQLNGRYFYCSCKNQLVTLDQYIAIQCKIKVTNLSLTLWNYSIILILSGSPPTTAFDNTAERTGLCNLCGLFNQRYQINLIKNFIQLQRDYFGGHGIRHIGQDILNRAPWHRDDDP